jgi:hypothetical protein
MFRDTVVPTNFTAGPNKHVEFYRTHSTSQKARRVQQDFSTRDPGLHRKHGFRKVIRCFLLTLIRGRAENHKWFSRSSIGRPSKIHQFPIK